MNQINLMTWFGQRELNHLPKHFVKTSIPLCTENTIWIYEKLQGRFFVGSNESEHIFWMENYAYFEDPQEAVLFELTWG